MWRERGRTLIPDSSQDVWRGFPLDSKRGDRYRKKTGRRWLRAVVESQGLTDFQFSDIHDVPTVCLLIEVFLSRDSFLFPLWERLRDKKGNGGTRVSFPFSSPSLPFSPVWNLVSSSYHIRDAVIREKGGGRKNGMIKRIRFSHGEAWTIAPRSRGEGVCAALFLFFSLLFFSLLFFFSSFLKIDTSSSSSSSCPLAWHWKGCNTGRTPGGSRRFSMKAEHGRTRQL